MSKKKDEDEEEINVLHAALEKMQDQITHLSREVAKNSYNIDKVLQANRAWALMIKAAAIAAIAVTVGVLILNAIGETL